MISRVLCLFTSVVLVIGAALPVHGQALLTFSGGNGGAVTLTLNAPVTYTITTANTVPFPEQFVFAAAGDPYSGGNALGGGSLAFTVNGGAPTSITTGRSNGTVYLAASSSTTLAVGYVVTLTAGSYTSVNTFAAPVSSNGSYVTYITSASGTVLSGGGVETPEPSTWALLGLGAAGMSLVLRRRAARV